MSYTLLSLKLFAAVFIYKGLLLLTHVGHVVPLPFPLLYQWGQVFQWIFPDLDDKTVCPLSKFASQRLHYWVLIRGQQHHLMEKNRKQEVGCWNPRSTWWRVLFCQRSNLHVLLLQHSDAHGVSGVDGYHLLSGRREEDPSFCQTPRHPAEHQANHLWLFAAKVAIPGEKQQRDEGWTHPASWGLLESHLDQWQLNVSSVI